MTHSVYEGTIPYWLEVPALKGSLELPPKDTGLVVVGSGFTGASLGYFLLENGFEDVLIVDDAPEKAATFRNAGHILYGTVESMKALSEIHGRETAKDIWKYSIDLCELVSKTQRDLKLDMDYKQEGYLVISISEVEDRECKESVELLNSMGFQSEFWPREKVRGLGFKNVYGARYEAGSAQGHPGKFRNGMLAEFIKRGGKYHSGLSVDKIVDENGRVVVSGKRLKIKSTINPIDSNYVGSESGERFEINAEACVLATNAYSPLVSDFFETRRLVEPFRGNIIVSAPLKHQFPVKYPHSFDHGYEYALVTPDNRLLVGGWRNNSPTKEVGTHSLEVNRFIENGLKEFVSHTYEIAEPVNWDYSWAGIMGSTKTGFPFVGATNSDRVYCCVGYNGHGFSWGHGAAKMCADIIAGLPIPSVAKYFNPKLVL